MLPCSICSQLFPYARSCDQAHQGVCHDCATRNLPALVALEDPGHSAPREVPVLALTPREQQAVSAYTAHLLRTHGVLGMVERRTEEDEA